MTDRKLDDLIHRYQNDLAQPEDVKLLQDLQEKELTDWEEEEGAEARQPLDRVGDRVWQRLLKEVDQPRYLRLIVQKSFRTHAYLWAASVVVLLGVALLPMLLTYMDNRNYYTYASNKSTTVAESITLPDGSKIILKALSTIALHRDFNQADRRVKLIGSAFFDVVRNPKKPFVIQAGDLLTRVLGTSFLITNSDVSPDIEVKVYTGRVSVQVNPTEADTKNVELLLTPNLKAVYHKESKSLEETLNDNPTILTTESTLDIRAFNYHEQKLKYILNQIEDAYQIDVILLNEEDGNRLLTGDLSNLTLYQKLNLICSATDLQYEIKGTKIVLKGPR